MSLKKIKFVTKVGLVALLAPSVVSSCTTSLSPMGAAYVEGAHKESNTILKYDPTLTSDNQSLKAQKDVEFLKLINDKRESCGFGALNADDSLSKAAFKHTEYLRYIDEQRPRSTIMGATPYYRTESNYKFHTPHIQKKIKGLYSITGRSNPYFLAKTPHKRVAKEGYRGFYDGSEVVASPKSINAFTRKHEKKDKNQFEFLLHGLLSVPYHASAILNPFRTDAGVSYSLHRVNIHSEKKGLYYDRFAHVAVAEFGGFKDDFGVKDASNGLLTYPCEGTYVNSATMQVEEPNPLKSKALRNSIGNQGTGHPIYIVGLDHKTKITLNNIKLIEQPRSGKAKKINTFVLNADNDPHGILSKNESFIIPLSSLSRGSSYFLSFDAKNLNGSLLKHELTFYY